MNIFALVNGADTAGTHYRLSQAFKAHAGPDWKFDAMVAAMNYINYPVDVPWNQRKLEQLYDAADVIHMSHFMFGHDNYDAGQGKPTILVHHGLHDGADGDTFHEKVAKARDVGMLQLGSTYDMVVLEPELRWMPTAYDLDWLRELRRQYYWPQNGGVRPEGAPLRIVHAPTNREIKGTNLLIDSLTAARANGANYELVLLERTTWAQTLQKIATADIAFDQPLLGYGCFAVECWGMGLPVIAGVADEQVREGMLSKWGTLPFFQVEPTVGSITGALMQFEDPFGRHLYAGLGTSHVERYHEASKVVERAKGYYAEAKPTKPGGGARRITQVGGMSVHPVPPGVRIPIRGVQTRRVPR